MMQAKVKTDDRLDIDVQPIKIVDFTKPKIEIIEPSRVSTTMFEIFGYGAFEHDSKIEEIEIIEEDGYEEQFGSEYMVSLNRFKKTNDWLIRAISGYEATIDFRFFIIFHESLDREAYETMRKFETLFDEYYFESELEFRDGLEKIFRGLETR